MKKPVKRLLFMLALLAGVQLAGAQTFLSLYSFSYVHDGSYPDASLVQASDGNLYGTTSSGGTNSYGTVFRFTTNGVLTTLYSFTGGNDGGLPYGSLVQASDGNLYGTTSSGGANGYGTVFRFATGGALTSLYSFTNAHDGGSPYAGLVQASDDNLYGTTSSGGTNGYGTVFRITTGGAVTPLYSFTGGYDGRNPYAGLVQASDGNLYGTTFQGGTNGYGAVFRITTGGVLTPLYSFTGGNDGAYIFSGMVQASDGNLYGTAYQDGTNDYGTVFRITTNGVLTPVHSFTDGNDGGDPEAGLIQASDGNLYGTTRYGGTNNVGVIFRIATSGVLTPLYSFTGGNGSEPYTGCTQASDGNLYGTTTYGGIHSAGTVYELTLPPPALNILPDGNKSILFWPGWNTNYILQSTTHLVSTNWVTVSNVVPTIVTIPAIAVAVTVSNSLPAQYFRLVKP